MKPFGINFSTLAVVASFATSIISAYGWGETSPSDPLVFWVNNNYDRSKWSSDDGTNIDDDQKTGGCPYTPNVPTPDYNYRDASGHRLIPCKRDLQDFTSLWVQGVTADLRTKLSPGSTITLSWGDVGSPNSANPTIDLFVGTGSGHEYLTNDTIAAKQIDPVQCPYVGRLGPGQSIQLYANSFGTNWFGDNFLWCGVSNGTGGLILTFTDGNGNTLATTTVYLQIVDIKQMYERWTVGDRPAYPPKTVPDCASEDLPPFTPAFRYSQPPDSSTPYILFVHGWNMERWEKDRYAESAFKRLYWHGYHGRFGEFRWPTGYDFSGIISAITDARNYDNSESNAWASATGLLYLLNQLNTQYPGHVYLMAHSMGNVVAGEALRQAGSQVVNTYIAMQAAIPAHCYDASTPNRNTFSVPDRYAHYWTNTSPNYFNGLAGAGSYVTLYNTNDYALSWWNVDQNWKPDNGLLSYPGYFYSVSSLHPNGFYVQYGSGTNQFRNLNFPGDTYTIFPYCDPAWSFALGAEPNVNGVFSGLESDLQTLWPPDPLGHHDYSSHFYHSAEFRGDFPQQIAFWNVVLGAEGFNLQ